MAKLELLGMAMHCGQPSQTNKTSGLLRLNEVTASCCPGTGTQQGPHEQEGTWGAICLLILSARTSLAQWYLSSSSLSPSDSIKDARSWGGGNGFTGNLLAVGPEFSL